MINGVLFHRFYINGKSRNLQKLLRYLGGIVTSVLKADTAGCGCRFASPLFQDLSGLSSVLYSNDLRSEALSSRPSISSL